MLPFNENDYQEITKDSDLVVGDIVWMRFKIIPGWLYVKAAAINAIEEKLAKNPEYEIQARNYVNDEGYAWYKVKIIKPLPVTGLDDPRLQTASFKATALISLFLVGTIYATLAFDRILKYRLKTSVINAIASGGMTANEGLAILNAGGSNSIGSNVQKAGIGVAIPIVAAVVLIYVWSKK